jgi:maltose phosphorylase
MNKYLKTDPWCIIEEKFHREHHQSSESIFSLGNGRFGHRGNFEENYSGESLQGNYIAGVYYPDKTKVGWWKNGYPEYFAKVLNAPNWIGIRIRVEKEEVDLAKCRVISFMRILNMKEGYLQRNFLIELAGGRQLQASVVRFVSMADPEVGAIRYTIVPVNFSGEITITSYLDAGIKNADANFNELFWDEVSRDINDNQGFIVSRTRKTEFDVCTGIATEINVEGNSMLTGTSVNEKEKYIEANFTLHANQNKKVVVFKYAAVLSSLYHSKEDIRKHAGQVLSRAVDIGFNSLFKEHKKVWAAKWERSDIIIDGDNKAQQGIRFNIFQLNQTYTGNDERLNIGPKGFTGEKYGGSTYWDTEAYCVPFFLCTAPQYVARNLLLYRYKHLSKAIENAEKMGFTNGAALYPMVTMNGEECHNEWEITFEEIHRNGAIAHAIYNYVKHTGDKEYLVDYGLEVLIALSRFWKQRVNFSLERGKYVLLCVTGPNEYENNVNNNWYTNKIATWTLSYTIQTIDLVKNTNPPKYTTLVNKLNFNERNETRDWKHIIENMHYPADGETGIFLQQDDYLDKEQMMAARLDPSQRPINQHWSWDRILRSCFIKQADLLQGIYLFEDHFDTDTIKRNFDFYEPRTVHESSLSPCVHSIVACRIGNIGKAYELYLRTSRLDLDDYNDEVDEGLHITSMAGTWMSIVEGFAGKRVRNDKLVLNPLIPDQWKSYSFKINFRGSLLKIIVTTDTIQIQNESVMQADILMYGKEYHIPGHKSVQMDKENIYK